ncbi:arylamine N-acetyltransferase [Rheinheimera riviphila]|uniref:Arylamine N-acetyltransferase n=2 Tax=Rheinheimera riviphila TaxID=1834037 RepID=A0A437QEW3_9GAMM|nr:arylamine N-acetyltransferase [Rheinheimera riviphila]
MHASNFQLDLYLKRVGFAGDVAADALAATLAATLVANTATVKSLMQHQLRSVPFENLDVQAGKIVSLNPEDIVRKIIGDDGKASRGGYCYEVNALFAMALTALGIDYQFVFCRPMFYPMRRPKTHMALIVKVQGEQWLCDLGFGSYGLRAPVALSQVNLPQTQEFDCFRLISPTSGEYVLQAQLDEQWVSQYGFDLYPADWIDFMPANYLNSTHPDTIFVQKYLVIQQHATGRTMLVGNELKEWQQGKVTVTPVATDELASVLKQQFKLELPGKNT